MLACMALSWTGGADMLACTAQLDWMGGHAGMYGSVSKERTRSALSCIR